MSDPPHTWSQIISLLKLCLDTTILVKRQGFIEAAQQARRSISLHLYSTKRIPVRRRCPWKPLTPSRHLLLSGEVKLARLILCHVVFLLFLLLEEIIQLLQGWRLPLLYHLGTPCRSNPISLSEAMIHYKVPSTHLH